MQKISESKTRKMLNKIIDFLCRRVCTTKITKVSIKGKIVDKVVITDSRLFIPYKNINRIDFSNRMMSKCGYIDFLNKNDFFFFCENAKIKHRCSIEFFSDISETANICCLLNQCTLFE